MVTLRSGGASGPRHERFRPYKATTVALEEFKEGDTWGRENDWLRKYDGLNWVFKLDEERVGTPILRYEGGSFVPTGESRDEDWFFRVSTGNSISSGRMSKTKKIAAGILGRDPTADDGEELERVMESSTRVELYFDWEPATNGDGMRDVLISVSRIDEVGE